jgi:hypothetical protein
MKGNKFGIIPTHFLWAERTLFKVASCVRSENLAHDLRGEMHLTTVNAASKPPHPPLPLLLLKTVNAPLLPHIPLTALHNY